MVKKIRITASPIGELHAEIDDSLATGEAIWRALPIEAPVNTWGDEIYFPIPVNIAAENPKETVQLGDLGYWPPGKSFCIFFGLTPASQGGEIRPASPVNVFGRILGDPKIFKRLRSGERIRVERASEG